MMTHSDDIALAERLGWRRARIMSILAAMFVAQQVSFFATPPVDGVVRAVDQVKIGAWLVLSASLLALLWTGGMWLRGRRVQALLNDEASRANRADALSLGFFFAMVTALILYLFAGWSAMTAREAIHVIVTAGIVPALLRYAMLEKRALK